MSQFGLIGQTLPPAFDFFGDQVVGFGGEVIVGDFVVLGHFLEAIVNDAVLGSCKHRLAGSDIVKACPIDLGRAGVGNVVGLASGVLGFAQALELVGCEPGEAVLDHGAALRCNGTVAHEELEDLSAFRAAQGRWFFEAGGDGIKGEGIVLGAPDGGLTLQFDLAGDEAFYTLIKGGAGTLTERRIDKGEWGVADADGVEDFHGVQHGSVVESDGLVVTALDGIDLGPAAVRILRGEQPLDASQGSIFGFGVLGG